MANEFLSTLRSADVPMTKQDIKAAWATHRSNISSDETLELDYSQLDATAELPYVVDLATKGSVKPSDIEGAAYVRVRGIFSAASTTATIAVVGWTEADLDGNMHAGEILWTGTLNADTAMGSNYVSDSVEVDVRGVSKILVFVTTAPTSGNVDIELRMIW